jgi:actin-like ATPase involved in cell morphogenesis
MNEWSLGIDFGTTYTVAAVAAGTSVSGVDVESNGRDRIPSSVFLNEDGEILVGTAAQHQAVFAPSRYEPTPKRLTGASDVFLEDRLVPVAELAAAVLRRVYTEACRQRGERAPTVVRLTHPAAWSDSRLAVLRDAAERAQLPSVTLVPEPIAAAIFIALQATDPGQQIAVYDFGGGTFDAAILRRTDRAFEVSGPPAGRDPLGGEDIDERIIEYLGHLVGDEQPDEWERIRKPADTTWRRAAAGLRAEVQRAKETLSEVAACQLWVPGLDREVQLTRTELERLILADVETTVDTLELALRDAGVSPDRLAGLYLVGGSSRIPLVAGTIWKRLGVRPSVQDSAKAVVAMGAAGWDAVASATTGRRRPASGTRLNDQGTKALHSRLFMSLESQLWPAGCRCAAELQLDDAGSPPTTIRARDEAADGLDTTHLAQRAGAVRVSRTADYRELSIGPTRVLGAGDGLERRFIMTTGGVAVPMFEQYLVADGRAYVVASPEHVRDVAQLIGLSDSPTTGGDWFGPRFLPPPGAGWIVREQLTLQRIGTAHTVVATRTVFGSAENQQTWRQREWKAVMTCPGAELVRHGPATVLNALSGELFTVRWRRQATVMVTKLGLAVSDGGGYSMKIELPHAEQAAFASLARHARLRDANPLGPSHGGGSNE